MQTLWLGGLAATEGPTRIFRFIFRVDYNNNADKKKKKSNSILVEQ